MVRRKPLIGPKKHKFPKRLCKSCGREFQAIRRWHDFCSRDCRVSYWRKENMSPNKVAELERRIERVEKHLGLEQI
jgi:hypothetical protein